MFHKAFSFAGTLLLTGAAVLMTPGLGQAQHGGGGHGGGGHGGGGFSHSGGGFSHGGGGFSHGGFNHGFHHGGFDHGFHHGGFDHGGFNHGFHHGGWWFPGYYGGFGYYPYYGLYGGYYPYSYDALSPTYDSGYSGSYGDGSPDFAYGANSAPPTAGGYQAFYPPSTATAEQDTAAHVTVTAPAEAQLWFNGTPSTATGAIRQFESPPLAPGTRYMYEVRARWNENGHDVTQTQRVEVTAGAQVIVNFPVQPTKVSTPLSH